MTPKNICVLVGYSNSGKTQFLNEIQKQGYQVLNCDTFVHHNLYQKGQYGYEYIQKHLGSQFINSNAVNRQLLKTYLLDHPNTLKQLTHMVNKQINLYVNQLKISNLLIELPTYFDYIHDFNFQVNAFLFFSEHSSIKKIFKLPIFDKIYSSIKDKFGTQKTLCFYYDQKFLKWDCLDVSDLLKKYKNYKG